MSDNLERLKALTGKLQQELSKRQKTPSSMAPNMTHAPSWENPDHIRHTDTAIKHLRDQNKQRLQKLYHSLKIDTKVNHFESLFEYKAMNLSGIGLKEEDFAQTRTGKYIQIIAITYEPDKNGKKRAKNVSLGYFGKAEILQEKTKQAIIEFVLRWRYEKAFHNLEHYKLLLQKALINQPANNLFELHT